MSDLRMMGERLLVLPHAAEEATASGIVLPELAQEAPNQGTVCILGPDVDGLEVDDVVLYHKHSGVPLERNGSTFLVLNQDDILAAYG